MSEAVMAGGILTKRMPVSRVALSVWLGIATVGLLLMASIIVAPLAAARGAAHLSSPIYHFFSYLCHQLPERSFHLAGHKFAVCSRCTGLYVGFAVAVLVYPLVRSLHTTSTLSIVWLVLAAAPLAIDFSLGYFGIWQNTFASRFITGALLSSVAAFFIVPGMIEIGSILERKIRAQQN